MSENNQTDKEGNEGNATSEKIQNIRIQVDRTKIEKELQEKAEKERLAREKAEAEKEELNKKLAELQSTLDSKEEAEKLTKEELEKIKKERDEIKDKLAEIAKRSFEERRNKYIEQLENSGLEQEKIEEIKNSIKTPADLDRAEIYLTIIPELLARGAEADAQANDDGSDEGNNDGDDNQDDKKAIDDVESRQNLKGGGTVPLGQPSKSGKWVFKDYREAIKSIRQRMNDPKDPVKQKEAKQMYDKLWEMAWNKLKKMPDAFTIVQCPICGAGILKGEKCPDCGFDPNDYIMGSSIFG